MQAFLNELKAQNFDTFKEGLMNSLHELIDKTEGAQITEYDQYELLDNFQARFDRVSFQN